MKIKVITASTPEELEVLVNKFIESYENGWVADVQMLFDNYKYVAMLMLQEMINV